MRKGDFSSDGDFNEYDSQHHASETAFSEGACGEWECLPGNGVTESMDAAGVAACASESAMADAVSVRGAVDTAGSPGCLDLRHLPAPEPLERALAAADALAPGAELVLLTPLLPIPLLQLLDARGCKAQAQWLSDGTARVVVQRPWA